MVHDNRASKPIIPMCDPHFHLWNLKDRPNPNLGAVENHPLPEYVAGDYLADVGTLPPSLELRSSIHVETIVGQSPGGIPLDTVGETDWVCGQMAPTESELPFYIVAFVHLASPQEDCERVLDSHLASSGGRLRGIRMILNHHDHNPDLTWPQVAHSRFFQDQAFRDGIAMLDERRLTFDLSCNPHQVADAVALLEKYPDLSVVVNHLGFLHEGEDQAHEALWRRGINALASLPNVYIKLSMLWFACCGYHLDTIKEHHVKERVLEVIEIMGAERCMFASNYPVDRFNGISLSDLYRMYLSWTEVLSEGARKALFHDTAANAYRIG